MSLAMSTFTVSARSAAKQVKKAVSKTASKVRERARPWSCLSPAPLMPVPTELSPRPTCPWPVSLSTLSRQATLPLLLGVGGLLLVLACCRLF